MAQYKPFVVTITARTDVLRLEDLHHLFPPTANTASKGVSTPLRGRNSGNTPSNSSGRGQSHNHGRGRGQSSPSGTFQKSQCQICCKLGHNARQCYHRFDNMWYPNSGASSHITGDEYSLRPSSLHRG